MPIACPAEAISRTSTGIRSTCSPMRKKVATTPASRSSSSTAADPSRCGPSSKVSAIPLCSGSVLGTPISPATGGKTGAAAGAHQAASPARASGSARIAGGEHERCRGLQVVEAGGLRAAACDGALERVSELGPRLRDLGKPEAQERLVVLPDVAAPPAVGHDRTAAEQRLEDGEAAGRVHEHVGGGKPV